MAMKYSKVRIHTRRTGHCRAADAMPAKLAPGAAIWRGSRAHRTIHTAVQAPATSHTGTRHP